MIGPATKAYKNPLYPSKRYWHTDRPIVDKTWYKGKNPSTSSLYIPVARYPGLYFSSSTEYCGIFYYYEPESDLFLDLGDTGIWATKYSFILSNPKKYSEYYNPKRFISEWSNTKDDIMVDYLTTLVDSNTVSDINYLYPSDPRPIYKTIPNHYTSGGPYDYMDQFICNKARKMGIDTMILQREIADARVATEILDTRKDTYSHVYKISKVERFHSNPTVLFLNDGLYKYDGTMMRRIKINVNKQGLIYPLKYSDKDYYLKSEEGREMLLEDLALEGDLERVKILAPKVKNRDLALISASEYNHYDIVSYLLNLSKYDQEILDEAINKTSSGKIIDLLKRKGAKLSFKDTNSDLKRTEYGCLNRSPEDIVLKPNSYCLGIAESSKDIKTMSYLRDKYDMKGKKDYLFCADDKMRQKYNVKVDNKCIYEGLLNDQLGIVKYVSPKIVIDFLNVSFSPRIAVYMNKNYGYLPDLYKLLESDDIETIKYFLKFYSDLEVTRWVDNIGLLIEETENRDLEYGTKLYRTKLLKEGKATKLSDVIAITNAGIVKDRELLEIYKYGPVLIYDYLVEYLNFPVK